MIRVLEEKCPLFHFIFLTLEEIRPIYQRKIHHHELRSLQYLDYNKKYVNRIFIKIPGYLKFLFKQQFCEEHQIYNKTFSFLKKARPTKQEKQNHQH